MPARGNKDSIAGQKARFKARAAEQERVTGIKPDMPNKATGVNAVVSMIRKRTFDEVCDVAEHVCDVAGFISDQRKGINRTVTFTITTGAEYGHEVLQAMDASSTGYAMFRLYVVPRPAMHDAEPDDDGDTDDTDDDEGGI